MPAVEFLTLKRLVVVTRKNAAMATVPRTTTSERMTVTTIEVEFSLETPPIRAFLKGVERSY